MVTSPDSAETKDLFQAAALYEHIESWWGEKFDDKLIDRMAGAPDDQKWTFMQTLEPLLGFHEQGAGALCPRYRPMFCGQPLRSLHMV
jgi:hypothetical protein